jgi:hypothetical protein
MTHLQIIAISRDDALMAKVTAAVMNRAAYLVQNPGGQSVESLEQAKRSLVSASATAVRMMGGVAGTPEIQNAWILAGAEGSYNGQSMDTIITFIVNSLWNAYAAML